MELTIGSNGSVTGGLLKGASRVDLAIEETLKGSLSGRLQIVSDYRFATNERYLIYGSADARGIEFNSCSRVRILADAGEDLKYLKGVQAGTAQAVLYGQVMRRHTNGERYGPTDLFDLVAAAGGNRHEVRTAKYGHVEIVPPGAYTVWAEQGGRQVTDPESIELPAHDERRTELGVLGAGAQPLVKPQVDSLPHAEEFVQANGVSLHVSRLGLVRARIVGRGATSHAPTYRTEG